MPFQRVPETAEFTIVMRIADATVEVNNTFYVRHNGDWTTFSELEDMAIIIGNEWRDEMMPLLSNSALFDSVDFRDLDTEFGASGQAQYNVGGTDANTALSAAMCVFVKATGLGGSPPRRGGLFISPLVETVLDRDTWDATRAGNIRIALETLQSAVEAVVDHELVLVSRFSKALVPVAPHRRTEAVTSQIQTWSASTELAIQRDRRTGHGV